MATAAPQARVERVRRQEVRAEDRKVKVEPRREDLERRREDLEPRTEDLEPGPKVDWPCWRSQPVTLGDHVRNVFLDLCSGLTVSQLQQTYPHHWGLLLSRLSHRPDLRLQLLDRVNRRA